MSIEVNKVVTLNYTLTDEEGNVLDSTKDGNSFSYLTGKSQIIPKLEEEVSTMIIGGKKNVKIDAANAYGEYDENAQKQVKRSEFPEGAEVKEGNRYVANSPDGKQMPFTINKVEGEDITIDFNHPLAGKNLEFAVELVDIRDATEEELNHGHVHGGDGQAH